MSMELFAILVRTIATRNKKATVQNDKLIVNVYTPIVMDMLDLGAYVGFVQEHLVSPVSKSKKKN